MHTLRRYLWIPAIILAGFFIWYFYSIIIYMVIASVIALIGSPLVKLMGKIQIKGRQLPDAFVAASTLLIIYGSLFVLFGLFIPLIVVQLQNVENIDIDAIEEGLQEPIAYLENLSQTYSLTEQDVSAEEYFKEKVTGVISSVRVSNFVNQFIGFTGDFFIAIFSITFITFFFLKERSLSSSIILTLAPSGYEDKVQNVMTTVRPLLSRYFIGVLLEVFLVGSLISLGLGLLGVENAMAIGFFAGLFNIIPYLGPIIGAVMGVSLTILGSLELDFSAQMVPLIFKVIAVYLVVQLIDNFVFQPYIYSSSVKAHPLEIFLVILMAGNLLGVGGMIVAIPAYTIIRSLAKEFLDQFKIVRSITQSI